MKYVKYKEFFVCRLHAAQLPRKLLCTYSLSDPKVTQPLVFLMFLQFHVLLWDPISYAAQLPRKWTTWNTRNTRNHKTKNSIPCRCLLFQFFVHIQGVSLRCIFPVKSILCISCLTEAMILCILCISCHQFFGAILAFLAILVHPGRSMDTLGPCSLRRHGKPWQELLGILWFGYVVLLYLMQRTAIRESP